MGWARRPRRGPGSACTARAGGPRPPRRLPQGSGGVSPQDDPGDHHDGVDSEDGVAARWGAGRSQGDGSHAARCGGAAPVTRGCPLVTPAPWPPMPPHALPVPEERRALRVESGPIPRVRIQAVFPWRQGRPCGDMIASVTFSQPERLPVLHSSAPTALTLVLMLTFTLQAPC